MAGWALVRGWVFSAWTTPATWAVDQLVTADDLNTHLRDNLNALKTPPSAHYECDEGSDYTLTSAGAWYNVDASNLAFTLTTSGGDVFVHFFGTLSHSNNSTAVYLDVDVDGSRVGGDDGLVLSQGAYDANRAYAISFTCLITGLSADEHTFTLQWKRLGAATITLFAGAGTSGKDVHPQFWAREMS
jgi:hypothetical protein